MDHISFAWINSCSNSNNNNLTNLTNSVCTNQNPILENESQKILRYKRISQSFLEDSK